MYHGDCGPRPLALASLRADGTVTFMAPSCWPVLTHQHLAFLFALLLPPMPPLASLLQWSEPSMVMLVFDVCAESSFNNLTLWLEQYRGLNPGRQVRGVVVGTKCDKSASRRVPAEAGEAFAEQNNMQYFETSAVSVVCPFVPQV